MTRRDFILLSSALRRAKERVGDARGLKEAATQIADALSERNAKFDAQRFLRDSGVI